MYCKHIIYVCQIFFCDCVCLLWLRRNSILLFVPRCLTRCVASCWIMLYYTKFAWFEYPTFIPLITWRLRIYYPCALSRRCKYNIYVIWITTRALLLYGNTAFSIGVLQSVIVGCLVLSIFEVLGSSTQSSLLFGYCHFLWSWVTAALIRSAYHCYHFTVIFNLFHWFANKYYSLNIFKHTNISFQVILTLSDLHFLLSLRKYKFHLIVNGRAAPLMPIVIDNIIVSLEGRSQDILIENYRLLITAHADKNTFAFAPLKNKSLLSPSVKAFHENVWVSIRLRSTIYPIENQYSTICFKQTWIHPNLTSLIIQTMKALTNSLYNY